MSRAPAQNEWGQPVGMPISQWVPPAHVMHAPLTRTLQGQFATLSLLNETHIDALVEAFSQTPDSHWTYLPYGPMHTTEDYTRWVTQLCEAPENTYTYGIFDTTGALLGVAAYLRIAPSAGSIEIGHLSFSPKMQRSTLATEALFLMIEAVFLLGYRRCEWKCNALNMPSIKAAERLGFMYEGTFRNALVSKGANRDTAWFSIIEQEWPRIAEAFAHWLSPNNFDASGDQHKPLKNWMSPAISALREST